VHPYRIHHSKGVINLEHRNPIHQKSGAIMTLPSLFIGSLLDSEPVFYMKRLCFPLRAIFRPVSYKCLSRDQIIDHTDM